MDSMKGAEAVLSKCNVLGIPCVEKLRVEKKYRVRELDARIRAERTKREARLLARAKDAGVLCPVVYEVGGFFIRMKYLQGEMLHWELQERKVSGKEISDAAGILVKLHSVNVVHGDYTPANLMLTAEGMAVIDFGLGSISPDVEDKATDVVTMKKALGREGEPFVSSYGKKGGSKAVLKMVKEIESRGRYMERSS